MGLRAIARIAVVVGALGSVALMLYGGHRNPSAFLLILFVLWDLSPFVGLTWLQKRSGQWPAGVQSVLHVLMLAVSAVSLAVYINAMFISPPAKLAAPFLVVPFVSWLLILIAIPVALSRSRAQ